MEHLVRKIEELTKRLQLKAANRRARQESRWILVAFGNPVWGKVGNEFQVLWEILQPELRERRFVSIETSKEEVLSTVLGDPVGVPNSDRKEADERWEWIWKSFPSAKLECEEAVFCYVLERNTASIFHSMRAAEIGLRGLARRMKIRLPKRKQLEWAEWQEILREMSKKVDNIGQTAKAGPSKDRVLELYSGAIGQFNGFKNEFRNQVMHVRKVYDEDHAKRALNRVRDFMEHLAENIDEKGRIVKKPKDRLTGI
jgi:HEPN domain-containing protein